MPMVGVVPFRVTRTYESSQYFFLLMVAEVAQKISIPMFGNGWQSDYSIHQSARPGVKWPLCFYLFTQSSTCLSVCDCATACVGSVPIFSNIFQLQDLTAPPEKDKVWQTPTIKIVPHTQIDCI